MNQDSNRDRDMPNRQSNMEPADGSRERGRGADGERNRAGDERPRGNSSDVTNCPADRDREHRAEPDRAQSER
jgi:hypothetical protein